MTKAAPIASTKTLDVFVVDGKKKPRKVGEIPGATIPATYVHEGKPYYFNNADLVANTITFTAVPNDWN